MLTDEEYRFLKPGLDFLEEYDKLGGKIPNKKKAVTFTISNRAISKLNEINKDGNKSALIENFILSF